MLLHLYCAMRCRGRLVAAALSFYPPSPPFYAVHGWPEPCSRKKKKKKSGGTAEALAPLRFVLDKRIEKFDVEPEIARVRTRSGNDVAVCLYRWHGVDRPKLKPRREGEEQRSRTKVILYSHGNAVDLGSLHPVAALLARNCSCIVVTYDYSGYGESTGSPSEEETYRDIDAVYNYLTRDDVGVVVDPGKDLVLVGESIGSGPAIWLSSEICCRANSACSNRIWLEGTHRESAAMRL